VNNQLVDYFQTLGRLPLLAYRSFRWRTGHWLPRHLLRHRPFDPQALPKDKPIDVMVVIVDHFEPVSVLRRAGAHDPALAVEEVQSWCQSYEQIAGRHRDGDGRCPQYTWFYAADFPNADCLFTLSRSAFHGFGEIEFHLHHGHDTEESFVEKLHSGLVWFNRMGAMLTAEPTPRQRFAYIAGNWALDNGAGDRALSGCNTELGALRRTGCYADFTFPALGSPAQPRKTNAIYYAVDCPRPKSYDDGTDVEVGRPPSGDLLIFQGPLVVNWKTARFENGALEVNSPPSPDRLDVLLKSHVHVKGRPEWLFVKLFTHGLQNRSVLLSSHTDAMFEAMTRCWGRPPFRLHFVTAREAYNIVKAAEAGLSGDPNQYRDYEVRPPANRRVLCPSPWRLLAYGPDRVSLEVDHHQPSRIEFARGPLQSVQGNVRALEACFQNGDVSALQVQGEGDYRVRLKPGHRLNFQYEANRMKIV
jgi:hypothetical protein